MRRQSLLWLVVFFTILSLFHPCHIASARHHAKKKQPCRYYLTCTCTRSSCEYWHPLECQFYKTETGCKAGEKCLFPKHKVDERPNTKPKKGYYSDTRRDSDDKNCEHCITTRLCLARLGVCGFSKRKSRRNPVAILAQATA